MSHSCFDDTACTLVLVSVALQVILFVYFVISATVMHFNIRSIKARVILLFYYSLRCCTIYNISI